MKSLIQLKNCYLGYGKKIIIENINLDIERGDFLGIVGPNGVGKTTILKTLIGLIPPVKGRLLLKYENFRIGYASQRGVLDPIYPLTVFDVALMGRYQLMKKGTKELDEKKVLESLKYVGIKFLHNKLYRELSGGQQQRVLLARALSIEPEILILDEPTNGLDIKSQKNILDILLKLHKEKNITVIVVTHLLNEILPYVNKIMLLKQGGYLYGDKQSTITNKNLSYFYDADMDVVQADKKTIVVMR